MDNSVWIISAIISACWVFWVILGYMLWKYHREEAFQNLLIVLLCFSVKHPSVCRNIGLFFIALWKDIILNLLCFIFVIISLLFTFISFSVFDRCCSFLLLKAIAIRFPLPFAIAYKIGRAINIRITILKRSHEPIYKPDTKNYAKTLIWRR